MKLKFNKEELLKRYSPDMVRELEIAAVNLQKSDPGMNAIACSTIGPYKGIVVPRLIVTTLTEETLSIDFETAFYSTIKHLSMEDREVFGTYLVEHCASWAKRELLKGEIPIWLNYNN